ncbi:MAG: RNA polymerase sigma factor [Thermoanaerobaculia bacterium]
MPLKAETTESSDDLLAGLFNRHQDRLYRLARRMSGDAETARDLVQETFLRAARRRSLPAGESGREAWLARVLVNLCRDRWRRRRVRRRHVEELPTPVVTGDPESSAVARATVRAALARLKPRRRAVIVLRELEGLPAAQIARLLGLRPATVRWHLSVGRKELASLLLATPEE